jgi:HEAT repeat protein
MMPWNSATSFRVSALPWPISRLLTTEDFAMNRVLIALSLAAALPLQAQVSPKRPAKPATPSGVKTPEQAKKPLPPDSDAGAPGFNKNFYKEFDKAFDKSFDDMAFADNMKMQLEHLEMPSFQYKFDDLAMADMKLQFDDLKFKMPAEWPRLDDLHFKLDEAWLHSNAELNQKLSTTLPRAMEDAQRKFEERMPEMQFEMDRAFDKFGREPGSVWFPKGHSQPAFAQSPPAPWAPDDQGDSLYRSAHDLMNRGDYRRAAQAFRDIPQKHPTSVYAADSFYWQAYALYRIGGVDDLREALKALETQRSKYPQARTQADAAALSTRITGALAAAGDPKAREEIRKTAADNQQSCDQEDQQVRAEALNALSQTDPESAKPIFKRVLAKRDACSVRLRRQAILLLGRRADSSSAELVNDVARNDTDIEVRSEAIRMLPQMSGERSLTTLEEIAKTANDERLQRAAIQALASYPSPRAKQAIRTLIERNDVSEGLRASAISSFERDRATAEDGSYLRAMYPKLDNPRLKDRVVDAIARIGGDENDKWLSTIVRNGDESMDRRARALSRLGSDRMSVTEAVKLWDTVSERPLREQLIGVYERRREAEATDKLIQIARTGTDPQLRMRAINALTRKNDPRATKLLMEIIDK